MVDIDVENIELIEKECRICLETDDPDDMIAPCKCSGTSKYVHRTCLNQWRSMNTVNTHFTQCGECHFNYRIIEDNKRCNHILMTISKFISTNLLITFLIILGLVELISQLYQYYNLNYKYSIFNMEETYDSSYILPIITILSTITILLIFHEFYICLHFRNYGIYCQNYAGLGLPKFIFIFLINLLLFLILPFIALLLSTLLINLIAQHISNTIYNHNLSLGSYIQDLDNHPDLLED